MTNRRAYYHTNSRGIQYYLHMKEVTLRAGKKQKIYYFAKDIRDNAVELPEGFTVRENPRNGFLSVETPRMRGE